MPDVFISFSSSDESLARFLHRHLENEKLDVFLAPVSLNTGERWSPSILSALDNSAWILFLASRAATTSPWVQQELGFALAKQKKVVPIVWDMPPSQLPGWAGQFQALNLAGASAAEVQVKISAVAERIRSDKARGLLIAGLLFAGLFVFGAK